MANQRINSVLIDREEDRQQQVNRTIVDSGIDITGFFGFFILNGSQIQEKQKDFNCVYLATGGFKGTTLEKPYSTFIGTGQTIITTPVIIKGTASVTFSNITFFQDHNKPSYLVRVEEGAKVSFDNCTFVRRSLIELRKAGGKPATNNSFVELAASAAADMVTVTNCKFIERSNSGATEIFRRETAGNGTVYLTSSMNLTSIIYGPAAILVGGNI